MKRPLVSCLCVTEGRQAFAPWLAWNFEKQTYREKELVIIDSSVDSAAMAAAFPPVLGVRHEWGGHDVVEVRDNVRVVRAAPGTTIGAKRNMALREASGDILCWFDDDDWQHPNRLSITAQHLTTERPLVGNHTSYFYNVVTGQVAAHTWSRGVLFNSAGFSKVLARSAAFDELARVGEDTRYMAKILSRASFAPVIIDRSPLFFWLSHESNAINTIRARQFPLSRSVLRTAVGSAWEDTDERLDELAIRGSHAGA